MMVKTLIKKKKSFTNFIQSTDSVIRALDYHSRGPGLKITGRLTSLLTVVFAALAQLSPIHKKLLSTFFFSKTLFPSAIFA